jgi:hypothetical protein
MTRLGHKVFEQLGLLSLDQSYMICLVWLVVGPLSVVGIASALSSLEDIGDYCHVMFTCCSSVFSG